MLLATRVMLAIRPATHADPEAVVHLLQSSGLPVAGLADHADTLLVGCERDRVVASAALELYGDHALLRSVAVDRIARGYGVGQQLTFAALDLARRHGARDVFLLTTTAEGYFPRFGFEPVARAAVPESVRQSVEFTSACPASAVVLRKHLEPRE